MTAHCMAMINDASSFQEFLSKAHEIEDSLISIGGIDMRQDRSDEIVGIITCKVSQ